MSTRVPVLLHGFVDDAAVFPPGNAALPDAVAAHRDIRTGWYAGMVGPLLLPASSLAAVTAELAPDERLAVGVIGDTGLAGLGGALAGADPRLDIRQIEVAVAKRGEDPQPGLATAIEFARALSGGTLYAEVPLTFGMLGALDTIAAARREGVPIAAKFRTGGLAAELFPTPIELAAVICACRDRDLPFKLTAGLHHALRHADRETGFTHHGFLGVLAGVLGAVHDRAEVADVAALLASENPAVPVDTVRPHRDAPRPLWVGFGSCSIPEPLADLVRLGILTGPSEPASTIDGQRV